MNEKTVRILVESIVLTELAKSGELFVPVSSSNRHIHLSQRELEQLFGQGYQLKKMRELRQPGQYACEERVTIETQKGQLMLRVVGPVRKETQIEISYTDAVKIGITPMVRMSGETAGTPGGILRNGNRQVTIRKGVMVAARHLHLSIGQAENYGLKDGDFVSLYAGGQRAVVYHNVVVRTGEGHFLEAHIDKDEANAGALADETLCRIEKQTSRMQPANNWPKKKAVTAQNKNERKFITEDDVKSARDAGQTIIVHDDDAIITPLARDAASEYHIKLSYDKKGSI